jgi:hypothetical protein
MNNIWKTRFDKLTYNLIYPAFIGNMIYDLLLRKLSWSSGELVYPNLFTCIVIVIFLIIDFMHLHGDMNEIVSSPQNKSWRYILIDIITSTFVFLSFVFFKEGHLEVGLLFFTLIPFGILWYKWKNRNAKKYFKYYSLIGFVFSLLIYFTRGINLKYQESILIYTLISTLTYLYFIGCFYVQKCKAEDEIIMQNTKAIY